MMLTLPEWIEQRKPKDEEKDRAYAPIVSFYLGFVEDCIWCGNNSRKTGSITIFHNAHSCASEAAGDLDLRDVSFLTGDGPNDAIHCITHHLDRTAQDVSSGIDQMASSRQCRKSLFYMSDEALYLQAAEEIKSGNMNPAIAAKAFAQGEGEENKTRAAYMELRVQQLKWELLSQKTAQILSPTKEGARILVVTALRHIGYALFVFLIIYTLIRGLSRL